MGRDNEWFSLLLTVKQIDSSQIIENTRAQWWLVRSAKLKINDAHIW